MDREEPLEAMSNGMPVGPGQLKGERVNWNWLVQSAIYNAGSYANNGDAYIHCVGHLEGLMTGLMSEADESKYDKKVEDKKGEINKEGLAGQQALVKLARFKLKTLIRFEDSKSWDTSTRDFK